MQLFLCDFVFCFILLYLEHSQRQTILALRVSLSPLSSLSITVISTRRQYIQPWNQLSSLMLPNQSREKHSLNFMIAEADLFITSTQATIKLGNEAENQGLVGSLRFLFTLR